MASFSPEVMKAHRARWYVWAWDGQGHKEWLPHTATMRGLWGWDVSARVAGPPTPEGPPAAVWSLTCGPTAGTRTTRTCDR